MSKDERKESATPRAKLRHSQVTTGARTAHGDPPIAPSLV